MTTPPSQKYLCCDLLPSCNDYDLILHRVNPYTFLTIVHHHFSFLPFSGVGRDICYGTTIQEWPFHTNHSESELFRNVHNTHKICRIQMPKLIYHPWVHWAWPTQQKKKKAIPPIFILGCVFFLSSKFICNAMGLGSRRSWINSKHTQCLFISNVM